MVTFEQVRAIALALPDVEEFTWFRTPAFRVGKKSFTRLKDDGVSLVLLASELDRAALPDLRPETYSIPPHYVGSAYFVVHLPTARLAELRGLLTAARQLAAAHRRSKPRSAAKSAKKKDAR